MLYALAAIFILDSLRMRGRLSALAVAPPSGDEVSANHRFVTAPGVALDDTTQRAVSAWARTNGLDLVDIVPQDLPAVRAMSLAQVVDPLRYRRDRIAAGRTVGHAFLVSTDVATRARMADSVDDAAAFARLAGRLKHFAPTTSDLVVATAVRAAPTDYTRRLAVLRAVIGPMTTVAMFVQPVFWLLMGLGVWSSPIAGLVALAAWHLQPLVSIAGTKIRSRDLIVATLFRAPIEVGMLVATIARRRPDPGDPAVAARPIYDSLLAQGTARFFEPRRETCPLCSSGDLRIQVRAHDLLQHKPGTFHLERCRGCGHVFQNPRLTLEGLDFYYKDFYDGLGEQGMEMIFGFGDEPYHARAKSVTEVATPTRWLDVGAGHGHFCCVAKGDLPDTTFDGLDLSESIDEAERRGWVRKGYRGLFPELAPTMAGTYDAVSMSHYLEHTLDPRAEVAAARTALSPGGVLMIEVPDPEFFLGRLLGKYWLPWFQPQHQHLLSVKNLDAILREHQLTPLAWHRGAAHQRVDFFFAVWLALDRIAPPARLPWRWRGAVSSAWRLGVWTVGFPFVVLGLLADRVADPFFRRAKISNTYRVVARREA
ncbi:MAG TPA: class I SAM-dependent methyltransferase [Kofleriaceae bacterium]|nr:class I SAM-dependent methyltransferase [Kofleriaceae bacterium]